MSAARKAVRKTAAQRELERSKREAHRLSNRVRLLERLLEVSDARTKLAKAELYLAVVQHEQEQERPF